jgi:hypothetical protein
MSRLEKAGNYLSVIAAFIFAGAIVLQDTALGSPRSIAMSAAGVMVAVVQLLHAIQASRTAHLRLLPPGDLAKNA